MSFFSLLVIPLRFQVITTTKPFERNGTSQKEHDICTTKQTLYISAKINMHKSYFDIITLLNHTNSILISINKLSLRFNSIFYEIKRTNYLYGNVISWKYIRIAMKISFSHILKTHYSTQCIYPMTSTVVNGADKMDPI